MEVLTHIHLVLMSRLHIESPLFHIHCLGMALRLSDIYVLILYILCAADDPG